MKALCVIDVQNAIVECKDFQEELSNIERIIRDFQRRGEPIIFIRNIEDEEASPFFDASHGSAIHHSLSRYATTIIKKKTPSAFFQTNLQDELERLGVTHVFITGFNTEFCCQFTAIAAYDRGFQVTFVDEATGTLGDEDSYDMRGLDIKDFVGTVLHWSNVIEVLDMKEYIETYG